MMSVREILEDIGYLDHPEIDEIQRTAKQMIASGHSPERLKRIIKLSFPIPLPLPIVDKSIASQTRRESRRHAEA